MRLSWGLKGFGGYSLTGQKKQQPAVSLLYVAFAPFSVSPFQLGLPVSILRQQVLQNRIRQPEKVLLLCSARDSGQSGLSEMLGLLNGESVMPEPELGPREYPQAAWAAGALDLVT